jgi:hypothetical protein
MLPRNDWRAKEAVLSLLAGDIYGHTPIRRALWIPKAIYDVVSFRHLGRTVAEWRQSHRNIRDLGALRGESIIEVK